MGDGSFRDIRNFPKASYPSMAVVVRMDARLTFANARKLKEFCLRTVQVREDVGDTVQYLVIDGKSINSVDLTGCEMIEVLAESLHDRGQKLVLANIKGPVANCLHASAVEERTKRFNGFL